MISIYDISLDDNLIANNLNRLCNQVYRLLPMREESEDWVKPLETLLVEIVGLNALIGGSSDFLSLIAKLQGMYQLKDEMNFMLFRRTIFECCSLLTKLKDTFLYNKSE